MKKSVLISAIAIGVYYLLREILGREESTDAFPKAKEQAVNAATE